MPSTSEIIDFCVMVADKKVKRNKVVPSHYFLCTDGKFRSVRGIPHGVKIVEPEQRKTYFVYWDDHSSTTFAMKQYLSEQEAIDDQEARIKKSMQDFKERLKFYSQKDLTSQFAFWTDEAKKCKIPLLSS